MAHKYCHSCQHYDPQTMESGKCLRYPPVREPELDHDLSKDRETLAWSHPIVGQVDTCGEWSGK
jgi:hypothetical protein